MGDYDLDSDSESESDFKPLDGSVMCAGSSRYLSEKDMNNFFDFKDKEAVNLLHLNIRSMKKNFDQLLALLTNMSCPLSSIAVSETWLTESSQDIFFLTGYNFESIHRPVKMGGGVGIFVNSSLNYIVRHDLCRVTSYIECILVEI